MMNDSLRNPHFSKELAESLPSMVGIGLNDLPNIWEVPASLKSIVVIINLRRYVQLEAATIVSSSLKCFRNNLKFCMQSLNEQN